MPLPMTEPQPDWIAALLSGLCGVLGRLMSIGQNPSRVISIALLWELPTAIAMGWLGRGIGEWCGMSGFPLFALPIAIAYVGPVAVSWAAQKYIGMPPPKG